MPIQQYSVNQYPVETLITWIKSDEIAIPEIQRPFVWNAAKVRDFIDSLYKGYPVGYLMVPFAFRVWCAYGQKGQTLKANGTGRQSPQGLRAVPLGD